MKKKRISKSQKILNDMDHLVILSAITAVSNEPAALRALNNVIHLRKLVEEEFISRKWIKKIG